MKFAGTNGTGRTSHSTTGPSVGNNEWNTIQNSSKTATSSAGMDGNAISNNFSIYNNHSMVEESFSPPSSLVLTAALMLIEGAAGDGVTGSSYDDSTVEDALSRKLTFCASDLSNLENINESGSPKKSKTPPTEYVYLLPRPWLHNWIKWAADQPVPGCEVERLKMALKTACEVHELRVPPSCGGEVHFKAGVRDLPHVGMESRMRRENWRDKSGT